MLASSGSNFQHIGKMTIDTDENIHSVLTGTSSSGIIPDGDTESFVKQIKEEVVSMGNFTIGRSDVNLTIYDENGYTIPAHSAQEELYRLRNTPLVLFSPG